MAENCETDDLDELHENGNDSSHLDAFSIWIRRPHVFNRRLKGAVNSVTTQIDEVSITTHTDVERALNLACSGVGCLFSTDTKPTCVDVSSRVVDVLNSFKTSKNDWQTIHLSARKLIPRQPEIYLPLLEVIVVFEDHDDWQALFVPVGEIVGGFLSDDTNHLIHSSYMLQYGHSFTNQRVNLELFHDFPQDPPVRHVLTANRSWLSGVLIRKLNDLCTKKLRSATMQSMPQSLSLVSLERYNNWYVKLKQKYGDDLVKRWPERTDPKKYVFEDISIAAYLLLYWEMEREEKGCNEKQSFIDLGCGNGLLVYLLSKEGHPGKGIDIRRRKIWDCYDATVALEEVSLHPNLFIATGYDWLIGNHSDELTPWIPFIAARSSYSCCYFVLPCCFHDFNGKFQRSGPKNAQYQTYLNFVEDVGRKCGFHIEKDTLRIPSTKRVCHIGRSRTYNEVDQNQIESKLRSLLESRKVSLELSSPEGSTDATQSTFTPRQSKEQVRNCTRIDSNVKSAVISQITGMLLRAEHDAQSVKISLENENRTTKGVLWLDWNQGGVLPIIDLVSELDSSVLDEMKNQCGGLQTLLRNHSHILKVIKGHVSLRDYRQSNSDFSSSRKRKLASRKQEKNRPCRKTKICWFYSSHPDGCPLTSELCQFAHGPTELQCVQVTERVKWDVP